MGYESVTFPEESVFLVTGGAGFIGSNLCEVLLARGHRVRCLDNLSTGHLKHVKLFSGHENYEFMEGDIRSFDTCMAACEGVDYVLHQAAWGSVPRSMDMPLEYSEINVQGTLHLLEAARRQGVRKFVYASSSSVYGDEPRLPKIEGTEGDVLSPYALTKRMDEEWAKLYTRLYGLDTYGMRYFNVFGKRQDPNGVYAAVIPKFVHQLLHGEAPTIHGDGTQSRDFTFIENVIEANLKACAASHEAAGEVYNIACGERKTLLELYEVLSKALGVSIAPRFDGKRPGDVPHSHADIRKAKLMLGYDPDYDFHHGIQEAIDWYRAQEGQNTDCKK